MITLSYSFVSFYANFFLGVRDNPQQHVREAQGFLALHLHTTSAVNNLTYSRLTLHFFATSSMDDLTCKVTSHW